MLIVYYIILYYIVVCYMYVIAHYMILHAHASLRHVLRQASSTRSQFLVFGAAPGGQNMPGGSSPTTHLLNTRRVTATLRPPGFIRMHDTR